MSTEQERAAVEADRQRRGEPVVWKPIETAPKDNKRLLYLARLDDQGKLVELDFDGVWEYWQESWELSHINGYCWMSANGIEEPTHWAYQDDPPPTTPQPAEPCVAPTLHNADSGAQNGIQATQPAESVKVPSDDDLIELVAGRNLMLGCDPEEWLECVHIALSRYGSSQPAASEARLDLVSRLRALSRYEHDDMSVADEAADVLSARDES